MSQRLGKAILIVNGSRLESMPGATIDIGGDARTTQIGANEVLGYTQTPKQSRVEVSVSIRSGISVADLHASDVPITFEGDTGQIWSIAGAWSVDTPVVDSGAGTAKLVYEGPPAEEII
ncbi:phage tail tube protein [Pseudoxanthomonas sp. UTMC 1351]|uniref:phage tail tube protein n=1 Tax=Pseudoxanthomonas sp. UTMC 1351 TaxID=2695853 RepID=UPI0034CE0F38